jgi:phosphoribosyl-ATP pyrophosphohydrolase
LLGGVFIAYANGRQYQKIRTKDMPDAVEAADVDVAIGGLDGLLEQQALGLTKSIGSLVIGGMGCRLSLLTLPDQELDVPLTVYTSYPGLASELFQGRDYEVADVRRRGGSLESYVGKRTCNAAVDIVETGNTMSDNGLVERDVLMEDIPMGVMFRKEPVTADAMDFEPWKFLYANKTLELRKRQFDEGVEVDTSRKNTLLLLSDQNKLIKTIGEEQAELVSAIVRGERVSDEANDLLWAVLTSVLAQNGSLNVFWAKYCRRNTKPSKSVKK